MIAEVIVDIAVSDLDRIFDYRFDDPALKLGSRVIVPFGQRSIEGFVINLKESSALKEDKIKSVERVLDEVPALTRESLALAGYMTGRYHISKASALRQFLPSEMRKGKVRDWIIKYCTLNPQVSPLEMAKNIKKNAKNQLELIGYLKEEKRVRLTELNSRFGASSVKALTERGFIAVAEEKANRIPYKNLVIKRGKLELKKEQAGAIESVLKSEKKVHLIHGVTGSGKTEVYLDLISRAIEQGKSGIMLVPEIALTPQMLGLLRERFGSLAAILHSGLSAGERFDEWWRLRLGEARIAIGARSAVFAPLEDIGIIIIDEEHESSYVSESNPRYSTFDMAEFRANFNGAKLILGSATPSADTFEKAACGEYNLIEMTDRINKKPMPEIIIADMRKEVRRGNPGIFSSVLKEELIKCLDKGEQALLFLNRRGYSNTVICQECGYVAKCHDCDVSLTYHLDEKRLKCHYCNAAYKELSACPECGSKYIRYGGMGTQRVVSELKKLLPDAKVLRMDNDTTRNKESHFQIINDFTEKKADILVGTQMIAKGHNFADCTLVGILDGDMSLHFADYRSGERTFQLITQVSGRSGRAEKQGKVVLQTYTPGNYILENAVKYDYKRFFEREISLRKATMFPPFTVILRVLATGEDEEKVLAVLKDMFEDIKGLYRDNMDKFVYFNRMKAPIKRIQNKYRYQLLFRIKRGNRALIDEIYKRALSFKTRDVLVYVEENPTNMS